MMRLMAVFLVMGLLLVGTGIYLICCTTLSGSGDLQGIGLVVALLSVGLLFLIPAKVYIVVKLTRGRNARG